MTNPDLQREAFERYANARSKVQGVPVNLERWPDSPHPKNGGYKDPKIFCAFEGFKEGAHWQAAQQQRTNAPVDAQDGVA